MISKKGKQAIATLLLAGTVTYGILERTLDYYADKAFDEYKKISPTTIDLADKGFEVYYQLSRKEDTLQSRYFSQQFIDNIINERNRLETEIGVLHKEKNDLLVKEPDLEKKMKTIKNYRSNKKELDQSHHFSPLFIAMICALELVGFMYVQDFYNKHIKKIYNKIKNRV